MVNKIRSQKLPLFEQARLLKILGELLQKGYPLIQAIEFLTIQLPKKYKILFEDAKQKLITGNSFVEFGTNLNLHADVIVYLYYAEVHGDLSFALKEGSFMLNKKIQHRAYFRKVMAYPIFLIIFLALILIVFRNFIIPQFETLFTTFQSNQHSFAFAYLQLIKRMPSIILLFLLICSIIIISSLFFIKKLTPIEQMNKLIQIPLLKSFLITMNTYEFSMQLSILLHAGFPIIEALRTMQNNDSRTFIKEKSKIMFNLIRNGNSLQQTLENDSTFNRDLIFIIDHGMNNSTLSEELHDYAEFLKRSLEEYFLRSIKLIQPIILIVISTSILSLYIAILFPMFQLMNNF